MADINLGDDSLLTKTLEPTDRVTITRATTGQTIGTMTVEDFMKHCARLMPVATVTTNGVMTSADRVAYPADGVIVPFSTRMVILGNKKCRISFEGMHSLLRKTAVYGGWWANNSWGVIEKMAPGGVIAAKGWTPGIFYVANGDWVGDGRYFIDIVNRTADTQEFIAVIEVFGGEVLPYNFAVELLDATTEEQALSNLDELI